MQVPLKQQPLAQELPEQQYSPGPPHEAHRPEPELVLLQMVPATQRSLSVLPVQQGSPGSPQDEQTPLRQVKPGPQVVPQQGCPEPPQLLHLPAVQVPPLAPPAPVLPTQFRFSPMHIPL